MVGEEPHDRRQVTRGRIVQRCRAAVVGRLEVCTEIDRDRDRLQRTLRFHHAVGVNRKNRPRSLEPRSAAIKGVTKPPTTRGGPTPPASATTPRQTSVVVKAGSAPAAASTRMIAGSRNEAASQNGVALTYDELSIQSSLVRLSGVPFSRRMFASAPRASSASTVVRSPRSTAACRAV